MPVLERNTVNRPNLVELHGIALWGESAVRCPEVQFVVAVAVGLAEAQRGNGDHSALERLLAEGVVPRLPVPEERDVRRVNTAEVNVQRISVVAHRHLCIADTLVLGIVVLVKRLTEGRGPAQRLLLGTHPCVIPSARMTTRGQIEDCRLVSFLDQALRNLTAIRIGTTGLKLLAASRNLVDIKGPRIDFRPSQQSVAVAESTAHARRQVPRPEVENLAVVLVHLLHDALRPEASPVLDLILSPCNIPAHISFSLPFSLMFAVISFTIAKSPRIAHWEILNFHQPLIS